MNPGIIITNNTGGRLLSIDALRGFDMLWIIGGSQVVTGLSKATGIGYPAVESTFDHTWGQFHFYDLIMPLFLFIVGVVMPLSLHILSCPGKSPGTLSPRAYRFRENALTIYGLIP